MFFSFSRLIESLEIDLLQDTLSNNIEEQVDERFLAFPIVLSGNNKLGFNNTMGMGMTALAALGGLLGILPLLGLGGLLTGLFLNYDDSRFYDRYPDTAYKSFR